VAILQDAGDALRIPYCTGLPLLRRLGGLLAVPRQGPGGRVLAGTVFAVIKVSPNKK